MPLLQRVSFGGYGLGAEKYCQPHVDLKRKFGQDDSLLTENSFQQTAKRHCDWTMSDQSRVQLGSALSPAALEEVEEYLPGCLKDVSSPVSTTHVQHTDDTPMDGAAHHQYMSEYTPHPSDTVTDLHRVESSMESDTDHSCSLAQGQSIHHQHSTHDTHSTEHTSSTEEPALVALGSTPPPSSNLICGIPLCRGQRPSPVSGRLHCHCSASWRGMYGMDIGYFSDYY